MIAEDSTFSWYNILILILMFVVTISTIIGNSLVLLAWTFDLRFRSPQNAYLFSLSIVDFLIGILILPADIAIQLKSPWLTNPTICKLRFITGIFLYLLSLAHLAAIAVDRYRIISEGVKYIQERRRRDGVEIAAYLYIFCRRICTPPVIDWVDHSYWPHLDTGVCNYENKSKGWKLRLSLALYFPCIVILVMYWKTFRDMKKMLRSKHRQGQTIPLESTCTTGTQSKSESLESEMTKTNFSTDKGMSGPRSLVMNYFKRRDPPNFPPRDPINPHEVSTVSESGVEEIVNIPGRSEIPTAPLNKEERPFSYEKERRAAKTLGIIIGAYFFCSVPAPLYATTVSLHRISWIHTQKVYAFFVFMAHANSGVNPFIYAVRNEDFKTTLHHIFAKTRKIFRKEQSWDNPDYGLLD